MGRKTPNKHLKLSEQQKQKQANKKKDRLRKSNASIKGINLRWSEVLVVDLDRDPTPGNAAVEATDLHKYCRFFCILI